MKFLFTNYDFKDESFKSIFLGLLILNTLGGGILPIIFGLSYFPLIISYMFIATYLISGTLNYFYKRFYKREKTENSLGKIISFFVSLEIIITIIIIIIYGITQKTLAGLFYLFLIPLTPVVVEYNFLLNMNLANNPTNYFIMLTYIIIWYILFYFVSRTDEKDKFLAFVSSIIFFIWNIIFLILTSGIIFIILDKILE
jgi:hypothetical protein